jgi:hypothetical protein
LSSHVAAHQKATHRRQAAFLARLHHGAAFRDLGIVEAPDRQAAEIIAVRQFKLTDEQR